MPRFLFGLCLLWHAVPLGAQPLELANAHYRLVLDPARPGIRRIENRALPSGAPVLAARPDHPLFAVTVREPGRPAPVRLTSLDFTTTSARLARAGSRTRLTWDMAWQHGGVRLGARVDAASDATRESLWRVTLRANRDLDVAFTFPILDGLELGPRAEDTWYFHPRWSGILNDAPADLASVYGQYVRMQVMAAYHPRSGRGGRPAGVYVVTRDTTMARKTFEIVKRVKGAVPVLLRDDYGFPFWSGFRAPEGIGMAVSWIRVPLDAGKAHALPPVALGIGAVDWRDALESYRAWARTWCPQHTRAARDCFHHASFPIFDQPTCDAALAELDRHPHPDYLQFMAQKVHVNGEYGYRDDWGLPELQRFARECRRRGILTNHYVEGYVASERSRIWKEMGREWGQMAGKEFQTAFANQCMWLAWPDWHRWIAGESSRLVRDLGLDTLYLDEIGFGTGDKIASDNPRHQPGRKQPDAAMTGVRDLLRTVRRSLDQVDPKVALYTEGPAVDGLFPYLDGMEEYSCRQWHGHPQAHRVPVHFLRFAFPDLKFAYIPEGTPDEVDRQVRWCLFNGIGTFTPLAPDDPASWLERIHVVEREGRDAFNDLHPRALVPTVQQGVYCNRFAGAGKAVYTLFNANDYLVSGQVLALPEAAGRHWVDLLQLSALPIDRGRRAVLALEPAGVAAIAALPERLRLRRVGERIWLPGLQLTTGEEVTLALMDEAGIARVQRPLPAGDAGLSLAAATEQGKYRAAVKLRRGGILLDLLPLPPLPSLDLAEAARATGSVDGAGQDARSVNGAQTGTYELRWNDPVRWVQLAWDVPQSFNRSELRCTMNEYSPQRYTYLVSDDGANWRVLAEVNREGKAQFDVADSLPLTTARFLRLQVAKGGPWADHTAIVRWRVRCKPAA